MPVHRDDRSLAAGSTVQYVLTGTAFEFVPRNRPAAVLIYAVVGLPAGGDEGKVSMDVLFGTVIVAQRAPIHTEPGVMRGPERDQHLMASGIAAPGDRIVVGLNSSAAAAYRTRVLIDIRTM